MYGPGACGRGYPAGERGRLPPARCVRILREQSDSTWHNPHDAPQNVIRKRSSAGPMARITVKLTHCQDGNSTGWHQHQTAGNSAILFRCRPAQPAGATTGGFSKADLLSHLEHLATVVLVEWPDADVLFGPAQWLNAANTVDGGHTSSIKAAENSARHCARAANCMPSK